MGRGGEKVSDYSLLINRKILHIERVGHPSQTANKQILSNIAITGQDIQR